MQLRRWIDKIVRILLIILMVIIVLDVLLQVVSRYLLQSPFGFTDELAGYLLIWVGLTGAAYATGEKQHLAIDLISSRFDVRQRKYLELIICFFVSAFAIIVLVIGGISLVYTSFIYGQISASLEIPLGYIYLVAPLSGLLIVYYSIDNTRLSFQSTNHPI